MNYSELTQNIEDICVQTFTADQLAMFTQQAEQKIYTTVELPAFRKNQTGSLTSGNKYLTMPTGMLYVYSLAVIDADGDYEFLLNKDVNFIREAYPGPNDTGKPKHYASTLDLAGAARPVTVTSYDGRPVKVEPNTLF